MQQFIAFLKDSYREATSGWMIQIMLVLAVLLMLFVVSIGFHPVTLQDELGDQISLINRLLKSNPQRFDEVGRLEIGIENLTTSNAAEPWKADYTFDFVVKCPTQEDMKKANKPGLPVSRTEVKKYLAQTIPYVNNLDVTGGPPEMEKPFDEGKTGSDAQGADQPEAKDKKDVEKKSLPPKDVRYKVTTKGTSVEDRLAWRHQPSVLFFVQIPYVYISLREGIYLVEKWLVNKIGTLILLLVSVIITAGFIPGMLAKGSLDLMVSKPIGRTRLLLYKYVGGLLFILILTTFTVVGLWFAIGVRSGIWTPNFFAIIPITTAYFAVLYAVSTTVAVFTRNTLVAIVLTCLAWSVLWAIGKVNDGIENRLEAQAKVKLEADSPEAVIQEIKNDQPLWGFIPKSVFPVVTTLQVFTPRTFQLDDRLERLIAEGVLTPNQLKATDYNTPPKASWAEMVLVSLAGIGVLLALASWRFSSRDY